MLKSLRLTITLGMLFVFSGIYVLYMNMAIADTENEQLELKKETAHKQAIYLLRSSIGNFTTLIAGIRSFIIESDHMPNAHELQSYTNQCLEKTDFRDSLVVSYLNESHVFVYSFTPNSVNENDLSGISVTTIRDSAEIAFLDNVMKDQELHFNYPINLVEGWLGLPIVFNVTKEDKSIGYVAALIDIGTILNSIYESDVNDDFVFKFTTASGFDFDRRAIYDNSIIYNNKVDENFHKSFPERDEYVTSSINLYGINLQISTAFKRRPAPNRYRQVFVTSWLALIAIVIVYTIVNYSKERKVTRKLLISNKRIAEQNILLGNKKEEFNDLLESLGDGVFELNNEGKCIYVNARMLEMLNMERKEVLNTNIWEMIYKEDVSSMRQYYNEKFKNEVTNCTYEYRLKPKGRAPVWVEQNTTMRYECSKLVKLRSIARDISENKRLKEELDLKESLYRLVSENSSDLIALHEPDGTYKYVSMASKTLLGYEPNELVGKNPYNYMHHNDIDKLKQGAHQSTLDGNVVQQVEYRFKKKNGGYIWLESYTKPILDNDNEVVSFQTSSRDISVRKREREQLEIAKKRAEEASEAKASFLSMMSHEIRTPLNGIIGTTHLLQSKNPQESQLLHLSILRQSSDNLMAIVNDILDFNKIEEGKVEIDNSPFNLKDLLINIHNNYSVQASEKQVNVLLKMDGELGAIYRGDAVRIGQILHNLMSNALKFTDKGEVCLKAIKSNQHDNFDEIYFEVSDSGIGIPKDKHSTIFNVFEQSDKHTTSKYGGSGLGLAITKKLLELLDSEIHLESSPKKGSTFSFKLILSRQNADKGKVNDDPSIEFSSLNAKILIVEDNAFNMSIAKDFLESWGCTTEAAENGLQALKILEQQKVDLVLLDLQMPVMDGYETIHEIRKKNDPYYKELPVIALSAAALGDAYQKVFESGMNDFITKPFLPSEFYSKLVTQLTKNKNKLGNKNIIGHITKKLADTLGHDKDISKFLKIFVETAFEESELLKKYLNSQSLEDLKNYAHKNQSSFKMVGLMQLIDQVQEIEEMIIRKNPTNMILRSAQRHYEDLVNILDQLKRQMK